MPRPDLPEAVQQLIVRHLDSVGQLEVLLLVRAAAEKRWSVADVARALVTDTEPASGFLEHLADHGLMERSEEAGEWRYRYAPSAPDERAVDALAEAYATRRMAVVGFIYARPTGSVSSLADAFRLRRDR